MGDDLPYAKVCRCARSPTTDDGPPVAKAMSLEQAAQKYLAPLQKVAAQIESRMTEEAVFYE